MLPRTASWVPEGSSGKTTHTGAATPSKMPKRDLGQTGKRGCGSVNA